MNKEKPKKLHYAWIIFPSCCAINASCLGIIGNSKGVFIPYIIEDLDCTTTAFTFYIVFYGLSSALALQIVNKVFEKYNIKVILTLSLFFYSGPTMLMSTFTHLYQWYLVGIIQGIAGSFILYVPVSAMINAWFHDKKGQVQGITASFSGIAGMFMNLFLSSIIQKYGWRTAYLIQGLSSFLLSFPFTAFLVVKSPEELGLEPYGIEKKTIVKNEEVEKNTFYGVPNKKVVTLFFILAIISALSATFSIHFSNYSNSIGFDPKIGAQLVSITMGCSVIFKLGLGKFRDLIGTRKTYMASLFLTSLGFLIIIIWFFNPKIAMIGAGLLGLTNSNLSVMIPLLVSDRYKRESFNYVFAKVTSGTMISSAFSTSLIGFIYDISSSYRYAFFMGLLLVFVCLALFLSIYHLPAYVRKS